jgi:DNA-directed RNA polymerase specialized sigma24 family protein
MDLKDRLNEIHVRMIAGSRTASRDLFGAALSPLRGFLANNFSGLTDDELHDLATDAIIDYVTAPEECDTGKSSLWTYLCMIARADAVDLVKKHTNRERLLDKYLETDVEFWAARAKEVFRGEDALDARHIMTVEGLRSAHQAHDDRSGWLMAARDHDEED